MKICNFIFLGKFKLKKGIFVILLMFFISWFRRFFFFLLSFLENNFCCIFELFGVFLLIFLVWGCGKFKRIILLFILIDDFFFVVLGNFIEYDLFVEYFIGWKWCIFFLKLINVFLMLFCLKFWYFFRFFFWICIFCFVLLSFCIYLWWKYFNFLLFFVEYIWK